MQRKSRGLWYISLSLGRHKVSFKLNNLLPNTFQACTEPTSYPIPFLDLPRFHAPILCGFPPRFSKACHLPLWSPYWLLQWMHQQWNFPYGFPATPTPTPIPVITRQVVPRGDYSAAVLPACLGRMQLSSEETVKLLLSSLLGLMSDSFCSLLVLITNYYKRRWSSIIIIKG